MPVSGVYQLPRRKGRYSLLSRKSAGRHVSPEFVKKLSLMFVPWILLTAIGVQYLGQLIERWFFFAPSSDPQNLYKQTIS